MMKSPITGKEMTLKSSKSIMVFRKENFEYYHTSYYCEVSGESFTTTKLDEININQVYNQYRDKHNIPFTDQIIRLRKQYNLSAAKMSRIFGFGVNSYRNYENSEIPSLTNGTLIRTALNRPNYFKLLVEEHGELSDNDKEKILKKVKSLIEDFKENQSERVYVDYLFGNKLPSITTGYIEPNMEKMQHMILYFAQKNNPSETKMNKLLFYSDFSNYRKTGYSISGTSYMAHNYGPVPKRFSSIFGYGFEKGYIMPKTEHVGNGYVGTYFYKSPETEFNPNLFSSEELETLENVYETFKNKTATRIKDLSHEETAWIENEKTKRDIDYSYAFALKHI